MATGIEAGKPHHNYGEPIQELKAEAKELLFDYAKIPEDEALAHVHRMASSISDPLSTTANRNREIGHGALVRMDVSDCSYSPFQPSSAPTSTRMSSSESSLVASSLT